MSASLVGSEMCIRDSVGRGAGGEQKALPGVGRQPVCGVPGGPRTESVSYTHLTLPTICSV
eukprot:9607929-Alexandrium_andersonii.AAC.1